MSILRSREPTNIWYKLFVGFSFFLAIFSDLFSFVNHGISSKSDFPIVIFSCITSFFLCERLLPKNVFKTNGGLILWLSSLIVLALSIPTILDSLFLDFVGNWLFFTEGYFHFQDIARAFLLVFLFLPWPILILGWKQTMALPPLMELLIFIACLFVPQKMMLFYGINTVVLVLSGLFIVFGEFDKENSRKKFTSRSLWIFLPLIHYWYNIKEAYYDHHWALLLFLFLWFGKPAYFLKRFSRKLVRNIVFFVILYSSSIILFSNLEGLEVIFYMAIIYLFLPNPPSSKLGIFEVFAALLFMLFQFEHPLHILALSY
ncbi:hypothetical protein MJH12_06285, partial [bacterium]|nr:hypothetical protein [bacterium]